jgi:hypothetical protein
MLEVLPSEGLPSLESSRDNYVHTCHGVEQAQFDRVEIVSMVTIVSALLIHIPIILTTTRCQVEHTYIRYAWPPQPGL